MPTEIRYTITSTTSEAGIITDQTQVMLAWTKDAPTQPGWYQAVSFGLDRTKSEFVRINAKNGEIVVTVNGFSSIWLVSDFSEWLGPFPLCEGPK